MFESKALSYKLKDAQVLSLKKKKKTFRRMGSRNLCGGRFVLCICDRKDSGQLLHSSTPCVLLLFASQQLKSQPFPRLLRLEVTLRPSAGR